jgi:hypothetical protein
MTTESPQQQGEMNGPFASLSPYEFVLLTTFRISGVGVPTAMWLAHEYGKLYMVMGRTTGKLKRIRTTSRVLLAPYDLMGNVLRSQIEAYAHERCRCWIGRRCELWSPWRRSRRASCMDWAEARDWAEVQLLAKLGAGSPIKIVIRAKSPCSGDCAACSTCWSLRRCCPSMRPPITTSHLRSPPSFTIGGHLTSYEWISGMQIFLKVHIAAPSALSLFSWFCRIVRR